MTDYDYGNNSVPVYDLWGETQASFPVKEIRKKHSYFSFDEETALRVAKGVEQLVKELQGKFNQAVLFQGHSQVSSENVLTQNPLGSVEKIKTIIDEVSLDFERGVMGWGKLSSHINPVRNSIRGLQNQCVKYINFQKEIES